METITGVLRDYAWGSHDAIPRFLDIEPSAGPAAEYWLGAHPDGSAVAGCGSPLRELITADPRRMLGDDVAARFGPQLPFLMKLIAPASPLSLQVHPDLERARRRFADEEAAGIPASRRNYRDPNHKPELVYALTTFQALCGFRTPRRAAELLADLDAPLARSLHAILRTEPSAEGIRRAFTTLLSEEARPSAEEIAELAAACADRLEQGSPSPRADTTVVRLAEAYPGDPGVAVSLLLNPVTLAPGEAMFVPAGCVHAYLSGFAVEVMASSDNVLRAGLTTKHVDVAEMVDAVDYVAAPPIRIAPEHFHGTAEVFYAPVDEFELTIARCSGDEAKRLPTLGPRIILCLDGELVLRTEKRETPMSRGGAVYLCPEDGASTAHGHGTLAQAGVP